MEKIELRIVDHDGVALDRHWHAVFGMAGGTIGRSGQNKLIIPDADSSVARVHAMVRLDAEGAFIANLSERNPIWIAGQDVRSGQEVALALGTEIRIGKYTLRAVAPGTPFTVPTAATAIPPAQAPMPVPPPVTEPIHTEVPMGATDPWKDLVAPSPAIPAAPLQVSEHTTPVVDPLFAPQPKPQHRPLIPIDFDPFAPPPKQAQPAQDGWSANLPAQATGDLFPQRHDGMVNALPLKGLSTEPLHDASHTGLPACFEPKQTLDPLALFGSSGMPTAGLDGTLSTSLHMGSRGSELDQAFNLPRFQAEPSQQEPHFSAVDTTAPQSASTPPSELQGLLPTDGLDLSIFETSQPAPQHAPMPVHTPFTETIAPVSTTSPPTSAPMPPVPSAVAVASAPHASTPALSTPATPEPSPVELDRLAQAFIAGAGLDPAKTQLQITPELLHTFGQALRVAVQGTIDLLAARSEIKREFRAGVTIIASGANNPLKFLPSAEGVIMQMINQTFPGFMKPVPAMQDAYADLHVHQLALMAGIRAAYAEALKRFDPSELERHTDSHPGLLDKILTNGRKAALWDDYKSNFDDLRRHAEDDLSAFSGRTFVEAYEEAEQSARRPL